MNDLGKDGEDCAKAYLIGLGYKHVDSNYRTKRGEIDLIMMDKETLVFVEVKTRSSLTFGQGVEAVDRRKQSRIKHTASDYVLKHNCSCFCRFDIMELYHGNYNDIVHYINAFE